MVDLDRRRMPQRDTPFSEKKRFDVLIVSRNRGFRLAEGAAHALILNLRTRYLLLPEEEAVTEDYVEVYCKPGPSASEIFTPRSFPSEISPFEEGAIYFGAPVTPDYPGEPRVSFYIEFRGCLFEEVLGSFKKDLKTILHVETNSYVRPFEEIPARRDHDPSGS